MPPTSGPDFYDVELRAHHDHLRAAYGVSSGDEVLDIGCGTGLTTREAARAAALGHVVGVDLSERMLERARQLTAAERLDNVRLQQPDRRANRTTTRETCDRRNKWTDACRPPRQTRQRVRTRAPAPRQPGSR